MLTPGTIDDQGLYGCIGRDRSPAGIRGGDSIETANGAATAIGADPVKPRAAVREPDGRIPTVELWGRRENT